MISHRPTTYVRRWLSPAAVLVLAGLCVPRQADAQSVARRFRLHVEGSAGTMLTLFQRQVLGFDRFNGHVAGRISVEFSSFAALQVSVGGDWFLNSQTNTPAGRMTTVSGGLRVFPRIWRGLSVHFDANPGVGFTGGLTRFAFDIGLGAGIEVASVLTITPLLRYHHVLQDPSARPRPDAQFWSGGIDFTFRLPQENGERAVEVQRQVDRGVGVSTENQDQDSDGVLDSLDQCPDQPAAGNNDRRRLGCPAFDSDHDGVADTTDQCREVPQGLQPHPSRLGCPDNDDDHDGVGDSRDQCIGQFQGFYANRAAPGCPPPDRDRDGVPDEVDACPAVVGSPSTNLDRAGCAGFVRLEPDAMRLTEPILYDPDAATLVQHSERLVSSVADAIATLTSIRRIVVVMPERMPGDHEASATLAENRARDLVRRLVGEGIDASRIGSRTEPVPEPQRGRRVELPRVYLSITSVQSPPNTAARR